MLMEGVSVECFYLNLNFHFSVTFEMTVLVFFKVYNLLILIVMVGYI